MRIYINNLNLDILNDINDLFKENLVSTKNFIELYTEEGIYCIENKDIYVLDIIDKDIIKYDNFYKDFTLIIDSSYIKKNIATSIHGITHFSFKIKELCYKLNDNSTINLIIKYFYEKDNFIPNDIYFESSKEIDINDIFIKKELIEFLSVLN